MSKCAVSVVIPTLDEEVSLAAAVASVRAAGEVIVVDGGSEDQTTEVARHAGARVLTAPASRGGQLDRGARAARGEWLVFLHADTVLEEGWHDAVASLPVEVGGGAFRFALDSPGRAYRVIEAVVNWRSRLLNLPYGDQALFVRRQLYGSLGGFRAFPLMEDVDFVHRLRAASRLAFPRPRALTSARRWERLGVFRATLENWGLLALFGAGCPPSRLATLRQHLEFRRVRT